MLCIGLIVLVSLGLMIVDMLGYEFNFPLPLPCSMLYDLGIAKFSVLVSRLIPRLYGLCR